MRKLLAKGKEWMEYLYWVDWWRILFFIFSIIIIISIVLGFWTYFRIANDLSTKKVEIINMNTTSEINGNNNILFGSVDEDDYLHFWIKEKTKVEKYKEHIEDCEIYEDQKNAKAYAILTVDGFDKVVEIEIHIPEGTLKEDVSLK